MSRSALLVAVRDRIRSTLRIPAKSCEITPEGKPHPRAGQEFISIHNQGRTNVNSYDLGREDEYTCGVTITHRLGQVPYDKIGQDALAKATDGLWDRADEVVNALHMRDEVRIAANDRIKGDVNKFEETGLVFLSDEPERIVGGEWFHAEPGVYECGLVMTVRFGRARRLQSIESQA